jgi:alpha-glucosidase
MNTEPWWHRAAVYQVYPRSFRDGNGDGLGDITGVIEKLDYLTELGVNALWLSPFYPSPQKDSGYDVADPRGVDPMYGTIADVERLISDAHARSLRVIVDVVPNHMSSAHPWFTEALHAQPDSPERARFHFRDGQGALGELPPNNWASLFGGPAWSRVREESGQQAGRMGQWYLHLFDSSQPDVNWTNPDIRADWLKTIAFWLDLGVDGFRVDVALGLAKDMTYPDIDDPVGFVESLRFDLDDGSPAAAARRLRVANSAFFDRDEVQDIYREWRALMNSYDGDRMAVVEAWVPPDRAARYVAPDTLHQIFGFDFLVVAWDPRDMRRLITAGIDGLAGVQAPPTWALSNHDSPRVVTRLGGGPAGRAKARALALLVQALPGSVYVYQGEELGLEDVELTDAVRQDPVFFRSQGVQKGRDGARVPLPWSGVAPPYCFTDLDLTPWLPQPDDWRDCTVEFESQDPHSTLNLYRSGLHLRRGIPDEPVEFIDTTEGMLAFSRGPNFVCVINCSDFEMELPVHGEVLISSARDATHRAGVIPPLATQWLSVS